MEPTSLPADCELLTLPEASKIIQRLTRSKRPPALSTVWRWATTGIDGVRLPTLKIGARYFTAEPWLRQFFAECAAASAERFAAPRPRKARNEAASAPAPKAAKRRRTEAERAAAVSKAMTSLGAVAAPESAGV